MTLQSYQIRELNKRLSDKIPEILEHFGIKYTKDNKRYICACPVHEGDNPTACNIYYTGDDYKGNWVCNTHQCQKKFVSSILGFVRGCLSAGKKKVSFNDAVKFAEKFLGGKLSDIKVDKTRAEKEKFVHIASILEEKKPKILGLRTQLISNLDIPAKYYLERGYSYEILKKYDVGLCSNPSKEMYSRAVFPIYDDDYNNVIGCTGRASCEACKKCGLYHTTSTCPIKYQHLYKKWRHSSEFKSGENLFNYWFAKPNITDSVIVVESPGNVLRLEEAGVTNSVGIFGTNLTPLQKLKIDCTPAIKIITILDNDENKAGDIGRDSITKLCSKTHNVYHIIPTKNDLGEMSVQEIKQEILPQLERIYGS